MDNDDPEKKMTLAKSLSGPATLSRLSEPAFDPLSQTKLYNKPGYAFTRPHLHTWIVCGQSQPMRSMNGEYHPRIAITLRLELLNVMV